MKWYLFEFSDGIPTWCATYATERAAKFAAIERGELRVVIGKVHEVSKPEDTRNMPARAKRSRSSRNADRVDGYDGDDLGESPDY